MVKRQDDTIILTDREKVRESPGMYIDDNAETGLATIVREIIDNAIDEYANYTDKSKPIECVLYDDNSFSVRDYGRGISPYESSNNPGQVVERINYTVIGAGGKFSANREQNGNMKASGLHGTGASATNFMSEYFDVTIWRDNKIFHDRYENGGIPVVEIKNNQLPSEKQTGESETGTLVHFKPDPTVMQATIIDTSILHKYFKQMTYLNTGMRIKFINHRDNESHDYYSENGLIDFINDLASDDDKKASFSIEPFIISGKRTVDVLDKTYHIEATIGMAFSSDNSSLCEAFTNNTYNASGGTHVQGFRDGLLRLLKHYYSEFKTEIDTKFKSKIDTIIKTSKESDISNLFKAQYVMKDTYVIIDLKHSKPILTPQTKAKLASTEVKQVVSDIVFETAMRHLDKNVSAIHKLLELIINSLFELSKKSDSKASISQEAALVAKSSKLAAAKSRNPERNELFIVEGDSAGGQAKSNRNPLYQAVLPIRGKIINAEKANLSDLLNNEEVASLISVLGCGYGLNYDESKLRYHKIIIATDQDDDGFHIRNLLITLIYRLMPQLLINGYVYILDTPFYINKMNKPQIINKVDPSLHFSGNVWYTYTPSEQTKFEKQYGDKIIETIKPSKNDNSLDIFTYSDDEQNQFLEQYSKFDKKTHKQLKTYIKEVKRNKGLGELTPEQTEISMLDASTRKLSKLIIDNDDDLDAIIDILMGDKVKPRRRILLGEDYSYQPKVTEIQYDNTSDYELCDTASIVYDNFERFGQMVIKERALPDVRDGCLPVQRAILSSMLVNNNISTKKTVKVKKRTGDVIGVFHPHGDMSVELSLVRMAVPWINPLSRVKIEGNQGSVFGDKAASGRYIEAKLTEYGDAYGYKLKPGIVPYEANYDNTTKIPTILPAQLPFLLIDGAYGIAVGLASNILPHNPIEVVKLTIAYLKNQKMSIDEMIDIMPAPDFPTGGTITNTQDMKEIYETGKGHVYSRATITYDSKDHALHVVEIPFKFAGSMENLTAALTIGSIPQIKKDKSGKIIKSTPAKYPFIKEINDYSGKNGIDIQIDLVQGTDPEFAIQELYAKSPLESTIGFQFLALNDKVPKQYTLKQYLKEYVEFQNYIVTNEFTIEKQNLESRFEIVRGLLLMSLYIDEVVACAKNVNSKEDLTNVLQTGILPEYMKSLIDLKLQKRIQEFRFTENQAEAIAQLRIYRISNMNKNELAMEGKELEKAIAEADRIISDQKYRTKLIIERHSHELDKLLKAKDEFSRKTQLSYEGKAKAKKVEQKEIPIFASFNKYHYLRLSDKPFENAIITSSNNRLGFIDDNSVMWNLHLSKAGLTPETGTFIGQLLPADVSSIIGMTSYISNDPGKFGLFIYESGQVKITDMSGFMTAQLSKKVGTPKEPKLHYYSDIPSGTEAIILNGKSYKLSKFSKQKRTGFGKKMLDEITEPVTVEFVVDESKIEKQEIPIIETDKPTHDKNSFDGLAIFEGDDKLVFNWERDYGSEGLFNIPYQQLLKTELLFVHTDGTAKIVDGKQFEVSTHRTSIQADKKNLTSIYIGYVPETLYCTYTNGTHKKVSTEKISHQGKVGGGMRVFYHEGFEIESVIDGKDIDIPISTFAMKPKPKE